MDPTDPHDRRDLVHAAADAALEVGLLSERTTRGITGAAAAGLPHGRVLYGYQRIYDPKTRRLISQEPLPEEAAMVRELFGYVAGRPRRATTLSQCWAPPRTCARAR